MSIVFCEDAWFVTSLYVGLCMRGSLIFHIKEEQIKKKKLNFYSFNKMVFNYRLVHRDSEYKQFLKENACLKICKVFLPYIEPLQSCQVSKVQLL